MIVISRAEAFLRFVSGFAAGVVFGLACIALHVNRNQSPRS